MIFKLKWCVAQARRYNVPRSVKLRYLLYCFDLASVSFIVIGSFAWQNANKVDTMSVCYIII